MQQDPQPWTESIPGRPLGMDYDGETRVYRSGHQCAQLPSLIARLLPDGTVWAHVVSQHDEWDRPTNIVDTYSLAYGLAALLHAHQYRDLQHQQHQPGGFAPNHIGPKGETIAGYSSYNGNHQVLSWTNAVGDVVTSYTYDTKGRSDQHHWCPARLGHHQLLRTTPSGSYTNWVQTRIDLQISRTNSFAYSNNLVSVWTNELGLVTTNLYDNLQRATNVLSTRH